jgi:hypothetical protein
LNAQAHREIDLTTRHDMALLHRLDAVMRKLEDAADEIRRHNEHAVRVTRGLEPLPDGTYLYEHQSC